MNPRTLERYTIPGPAGALEVALNVPDGPLAGIALVAHPNPAEGGTLDNKVAHTLAKAFYSLRYAAVRFNFRGVGALRGPLRPRRGRDRGRAGRARARAREARRRSRVALAGFSFGAFVVSRVARRVDAERLVLVGPAVGRFPVDAAPADTIVIHGEQDDVVPLADVFAWARPQELPVVVFPGCGHFFHGRLPQLAHVVTSLWHRHPAVPGA